MAGHRGVGVAPEADPHQLQRQFADLLHEATAATHGGRPPRVLFLLDGLDEIERLDPTFAEVPFQLSGPNVIWVCAGRPERTLEQAFRPNRCTHVFSGNLPPMKSEDVRAMFLEKLTPNRRCELLLLDRERLDPRTGKTEMVNPAVEAVIERAAGLPLYIHLVTEDVNKRHIHVTEFERRLPRGLPEYFEDLLRRQAVGELPALMTPLVVLLAWAPAPLDEETLHWLLVRRGAVSRGRSGRELLRRGLDALQQSVIREAAGQGGRTCYEPYHLTFREHIRTDEQGTIGNQNPADRRVAPGVGPPLGEVPGGRAGPRATHSPAAGHPERPAGQGGCRL